MAIENDVLALIKEPILKMGYEEVSVKFQRENGIYYLHVFVDKDDAISLEDIVAVNELISPLLDESNLIDGQYILDVSSYGAEKNIDVAKLEKYVGKYVNVHLVNPYKGENYLEGTLESAASDEIVISFYQKTRLIKANVKREDVDKARLAIKF